MAKSSKNNNLVKTYRSKKVPRKLSNKPSFCQKLGAFLLEGWRPTIFTYEY